MRSLTAREILDLWEQGQWQDLPAKALSLLAVACQEKNSQELAGLSLGNRDALLLSLREAMFGRRMEAFAECPSCHEKLEFSLDSGDLLPGQPVPEGPQTLQAGEFDISFRLPTSLDVRACLEDGGAEAARTLMARCVLAVRRDNAEVGSESLPAEAVASLSSRMRDIDPLLETEIALNCPACGTRWTMVMDMPSFLWAELDRQAKTLLRQVDILARAYGWKETDILDMSGWRRQHYIDMAAS